MGLFSNILRRNNSSTSSLPELPNNIYNVVAHSLPDIELKVTHQMALSSFGHLFPNRYPAISNMEALRCDEEKLDCEESKGNLAAWERAIIALSYRATQPKGIDETQSWHSLRQVIEPLKDYYAKQLKMGNEESQALIKLLIAVGRSINAEFRSSAPFNKMKVESIMRSKAPDLEFINTRAKAWGIE